MVIADHPYITPAKGLSGWVGEKWQFLLTFSTINADVKGGWMGQKIRCPKMC